MVLFHNEMFEMVACEMYLHHFVSAISAPVPELAQCAGVLQLCYIWI